MTRRVPDGDSIFGIGSATKVFTALPLADMVRTGDAALLDPVVVYLPSTLKMPEPDGE
jgi:serine-type D-Ala-D-Ala carboxypeptidase/endopeptidase